MGKSFAFAPRVERIPNRRKTSEHVTKIDKIMRTIIIHVRPATIFVTSSLNLPGYSPGETYRTSCYPRWNLTGSQQGLERPYSVR